MLENPGLGCRVWLGLSDDLCAPSPGAMPVQSKQEMFVEGVHLSPLFARPSPPALHTEALGTQQLSRKGVRAIQRTRGRLLCSVL